MTTDHRPDILVSTEHASQFGVQAAVIAGLIHQRTTEPSPNRVEHAGEFWWLPTADYMVLLRSECGRVGLQRGIDAGLIAVEQFPSDSGTTPGYRVTEFPPVPADWDRQ